MWAQFFYFYINLKTSARMQPSVPAPHCLFLPPWYGLRLTKTFRDWLLTEKIFCKRGSTTWGTVDCLHTSFTKIAPQRVTMLCVHFTCLQSLGPLLTQMIKSSSSVVIDLFCKGSLVTNGKEVYHCKAKLWLQICSDYFGCTSTCFALYQSSFCLLCTVSEPVIFLL